MRVARIMSEARNETRFADFLAPYFSKTSCMILFEDVWANEELVDVLCDNILPSHTELCDCQFTVSARSGFVSQDEELRYFKNLKKVGKAIGQIPLLQALWIMPSSILDGQLEIRAAAFILQYARQITNLHASFGRNDYTGINEMAMAIEKHPNLKSVSLTSLESDPCCILQRALLTIPNLRELNISYTKPRGEAELILHPMFMKKLIQKPSMRSLRLEKCVFSAFGQITTGLVVSVDQVTAICDGLASCSTRLEALELVMCDLPVGFADQFAQSIKFNKSLIVLALKPVLSHGSFLGNSGLTLGNALGTHPCLQELTLSMPENVSKEESRQWSSLMNELESSSLQKLTLINFLWTPAMCDGLRRILRQNLSLLAIIGLEADVVLPAIASCLAETKSLERLFILDSASFGNNLCLSGERVLSIAGGMPQSSSSFMNFARSLQFVECSAKSLISIVRSFRQARRLKSIELYFRIKLDNDSASDLIEAVKGNYSLITFPVQASFPLHDTSTTARFQDLLSGLLRMNCAGRRYIRDDPSDKRTAIRVLESASTNLSCLFIHLKENSFLFHDNHGVTRQSFNAHHSTDMTALTLLQTILLNTKIQNTALTASQQNVRRSTRIM